jgi:hypothetical protein
MTAMGWGAVWQAAWTQFGAEAVEIQLLILVAAAFCALMILIGLRHAFHAAGPAADEPLPELPKRVFAVAPAVPVVDPAPAPQRRRVLRPAQRMARKTAKRTINHLRPVRPQIRRAGKSVECDGPYSPLPPQG